jgi:hypothetical protein
MLISVAGILVFQMLGVNTVADCGSIFWPVGSLITVFIVAAECGVKKGLRNCGAIPGFYIDDGPVSDSVENIPIMVFGVVIENQSISTTDQIRTGCTEGQGRFCGNGFLDGVGGDDDGASWMPVRG